jgi:hypothetical protein
MIKIDFLKKSFENCPDKLSRSSLLVKDCVKNMDLGAK